MTTLFKTRRDVLRDIVDNYDKVGTAISTGYPRLDEAMGGGLYPGKFYIFAARKKVGKTMLLGGISRHLNRSANTHLWLALEMNGMELEQRQLSRDLKINPLAFLRHRETKLQDRVREIAGNGIADNVVYCDYPGIPLNQLAAIVADAVDQYAVTGVIIDFLQLVNGGTGDNMSVHHDAVAYTCANLAKTLNIWVVAAAQLNQEHNFRGGEGALMAADQVYHLAECEKDGALYISLRESRYTRYMDVGTQDDPGYLIREEGPYLEEMPL